MPKISLQFAAMLSRAARAVTAASPVLRAPSRGFKTLDRGMNLGDSRSSDAFKCTGFSFYSEGTVIRGFRVEKILPVPSLQLTAILLRHEQFGTPYLHVYRDDRNNAFRHALFSFSFPLTHTLASCSRHRPPTTAAWRTSSSTRPSADPTNTPCPPL